jgi:hypothetical protein
MMRQHVGLALLGFGLLIGCRPAGPELGDVTGHVTLDGKPLADATITFQPVADGYTSIAVTDEQGHYQLQFAQGGNGAMVGSHKVIIETGGMRTDPEGNAYAVPERLPAQYNVETKLTREVASGKQTLNFELKSKP